MDYKELIEAALSARTKSYSPYSGFCCGAALLCDDGTIYQGINIENGSYGATICAERTAIFKAVSEGKRKFLAIAVVGAKAELEVPDIYAYPCGMCRQVMTEFFDNNTKIIIARTVNDYKEYNMEELVPFAFEL